LGEPVNTLKKEGVMDSHLSVDDFLRFLMDKESLDSETIQTIQEHIEQCPECGSKKESFLATLIALEPSQEEVEQAWEDLRESIAEGN
jgi:Uma2 family endonuclease